jgi:hypothetical protein
LTETPPPTVPPGQPLDSLWQRLAEAQDAALLAGRSVSGVDPVPTVRGLASRRWVRRRRAGVLVLALGTMAAGIAIYARQAPLRVQLGRGGQTGTQGDALVADARSDLPLLFSDGSTVTFRAGAVGRMQRLTAAGAELEIERGRLEAHVIHAASTVWLVHAGPYRVRVTGTRFVVDWVNPRLNVAVYQGSVVVDGGALGAGVPLHAGQHLTVRDGVVRVEALPAGQSSVVPQGDGRSDEGRNPDRTVALARRPGPDAVQAGAGSSADRLEPLPGPEADGSPRLEESATTTAETGAAESEADGVRSPAMRRPGARPSGARAGDAAAAARDRDWLAPAERREYAEALSIARRVGWPGLCARLDARRLLMLGDVARYAGAPQEAGAAFKALVQRFPETRLAGDAVFSLGRLAFEADHAREAAAWFRLYVRRWPSGPLVDQATGRLMECAVRVGDDAAARAVARDYLGRAPRGPHAPLANKILGEGNDRLSGAPSGAR